MNILTLIAGLIIEVYSQDLVSTGLSRVDDAKSRVLSVPNCADPTQQTCTSCNSGYYLLQNTCIRCTSPCSNCNSSSECIDCIPAYYVLEGNCIQCSPLCQSCNSTSCSTCASNATLQSNTCVCLPGYFQSGNTCNQCTTPNLKAIIAGPTVFSTQCSTLEYSSKYSVYNSSQSISYSWTVTQTSSNVIWNSTYNTSDIQVTGYSSVNSVLNVTLVIASCGVTSSSSFFTNITNTLAFIVSHSAGQVVQARVNQPLTLCANVVDMCELTGTPTWTWTGNISAVGMYYYIPKNTLTPGTYNITLQGIIGKVIGISMFQIVIIENSLVVVLSRSSGIVSNSTDLFISAAGSYDPDMNSSLSFEWSCENLNQTICLDQTGYILVNSSEPNLTISRQNLNIGASLVIYVNVHSKTKAQVLNITLTVQNTNTSAIIVQTSNPINPQIGLSVPSIVQGNTSYISWVSLNKVLMQTYNMPVMTLNPGTLSYGSAYTFELRINNVTYASVSITTSTPPQCPYSTFTSPDFLNFGSGLQVVSPVCYDNENYPVLYSINQLTPLAPYINTNILLPSGQNTLTIYVCNSASICITVTSQIFINTYQLNDAQILAAYQQYSSNLTLVPLTVIALAYTEPLSSQLISRMWSDLKTYQSTFNSSLTPLIAAAQALISPVQNTTYAWADKIIGDVIGYISVLGINTIDMSYCLGAVSNVFDIKKSGNMTLTKNLMDYCVNNYTYGYLPGQLYYFDTNYVTAYKNTMLGNKFFNFNVTISNRNISLPSVMPFQSSDIVNLYIYLYKNKGNYTDIIDIYFTSTGTYSNATLNQTTEAIIPIKNLANPINSSLVYYKPVKNEWLCSYYMQNNWYLGCNIISNSYQYISFNTNHLSIFAMYDIYDMVLPPPVYNPVTVTCGSSYNAIWILIVVLFIFIITLPLLWLGDKATKADLKKNYNTVKKEEKVENSIPSPSFSEESSRNNMSYDYAIQYPAKSITSTSNRLLICIESHLLFGICVPRTEFTRVLRFVTLLTVLVSQLTIEGLMFYGFETTSAGVSGSSYEYFSDYKTVYLGYMIFAVVVTGMLEVCLIILFSMKGKMRSFGVSAGVVLCVVINLAGIAGIIYMSVIFCPNWSGYWSISFLIGCAIEIFLIQLFYMVFRVIAIK